MRRCLLVCLLLFGSIKAVSAEETVPHHEPITATYTVRTGEQLQAPHVLTYRMVEYSQQRGRWVFPDLGAYDTGHGEDELLFAGVGAEFRPGKRATLTQVLYFGQDTGPGSHGARSLWVWPVLDLTFTPRLTAEAVVYPTIPLNRAQQAGFDVDRAKLEYVLRRNLTAGCGYSATIRAGSAWQNKPLLTTTVSTRAGSFEFWLQRIPGGGEVQLRYQLVHTGR
jgi:hypothetical protein